MKWAEWAGKQNVNKYDWLDYIKDCRLLGLDTRKKSILFPEDFAEVHKQLSEQVEIQPDRAGERCYKESGRIAEIGHQKEWLYTENRRIPGRSEC